MESYREDEAEIGVLILVGQMNMYNLDSVRMPIKAMITEGRLRICVDFAHVESIDSAALGTLINVVSQLRKRGGFIVLCNVGPGVQKVIKLTRLTNFFQIAPTRADAITQLRRLPA